MARKSERADALDKHIGNRIRQQRENLGMTQGELAQKTGVSYQQVHKYECGSNRISAGRLGLIAEVLNMPIQNFYDDFPGRPVAEGIRLPLSVPEEQDSRLCLEVARNFRQINNPRYREALHLLVRILAD